MVQSIYYNVKVAAKTATELLRAPVVQVALTVTGAGKLIVNNGTPIPVTTGTTVQFASTDPITSIVAVPDDSSGISAVKVSGLRDGGYVAPNTIQATENPGRGKYPCFPVEADPVSGEYPTTQTVKLSCYTKGAKIYYTDNGKEPTIESTPYSRPISVAATKTIKAIAVKEGMLNSPVSVFNYKITGK